MTQEEVYTLVTSNVSRGSLYGQGTAIELGACDGLFLSNTLRLEREGWKCLCIEGNPHYADRLLRNRQHSLICAVSDRNGVAHYHSHYSVGGNEWASNSRLDQESADTFMVPSLRLDTILADTGFINPDFLSLDVEGAELAVLKSLGDVRPKLVLVEVCLDTKGEIPEYMKHMGYKLVAADTQDHFYAY